MRRRKRATAAMENRRVLKNYLKWCAAQGWDWMIGLASSPNTAATEMDQNFHKLIGEIENADATDNFRWIRFVSDDDNHDRQRCVVLVGGLADGDSERWTKRWTVINEHQPEARAISLYNYRNRKRLHPMLKELVKGKRFDIQMQLGPATAASDHEIQEQ